MYRFNVNKKRLHYLELEMECRKQKFSFSEPIYLLFTFVLFNRNSHCKSRCYEQSEFDSAASNLVQSANWKGNYDDGV